MNNLSSFRGYDLNDIKTFIKAIDTDDSITVTEGLYYDDTVVLNIKVSLPHIHSGVNGIVTLYENGKEDEYKLCGITDDKLSNISHIRSISIFLDAFIGYLDMILDLDNLIHIVSTNEYGFSDDYISTDSGSPVDDAVEDILDGIYEDDVSGLI